ncbi:TRAP transporter large permease subunit [Neisseriaceae bacterium PsAf]|nr:TRAP transporter large permease subunit [Neisseriaceae bacterium PsAf]MCV2502855.1 TRAP transporter large permease subunit [Neisseriaceae bacterium]
MNTALLSISIMLILALIFRVHVVISLFLGALLGGIFSGVPLNNIILTFENGLSRGASIALSYGLLGVFSVALSYSGLPQIITESLLKIIKREHKKVYLKPQYVILAIIAFLGILSETIIPIHVAFVFIFIHPLLLLFNQLNLDRRVIACTICFGLITGYMLFPIGFGNVYLNEVLLKNLAAAQLDTSNLNVFKAMLIPALGMLVGLLIAIFFTYRRPKFYKEEPKLIQLLQQESQEKFEYSFYDMFIASLAITITFLIQIFYHSLLFGTLAGILFLFFGRVIHRHQSDELFDKGFKMMTMIGLIMITAAGFSNFIQVEGNVSELVQSFLSVFDSPAMVVAILLLAGLFITLGIGSSFATVPILATIYVPIGLQLGLSPMAILALVGTAGALGDAGSPTSDSTLAPSAVLNLDGQHNHLKDTVLPTFIHFNIPLIIFGWCAVMYLA